MAKDCPPCKDKTICCRDCVNLSTCKKVCGKIGECDNGQADGGRFFGLFGSKEEEEMW